jgi:S-adenosylmethionine:tRNA ribosyltransferase-isomerase
VRRGDFDYELPPELIAQAPLPRRSDSRLLLLDGARKVWSDHRITDLLLLLDRDDLLVFNDTRVLPARVPGRRTTGGRVEIFLERPLPDRRALAQLRASKALRVGQEIETAGGSVQIAAQRGEFWELQLPQPALEFFERHGAVPLPPYIRRAPTAADQERYQSILARVPGAVAAPTASLHFDRELLAALEARGVQRAVVTLHVGAGTFRPLRRDIVEEHRMHAERYEVDAAAIAAIARARAAGGRVIAVGTTVARALESAALAGFGTGAGVQGDTALFIRPGYRFEVVDALLTNFHLPQSTLLMLVAAFAGRESVLAAYAHAIHERYRFFSYGDAMLVLPQPGVRA